MAAPISARRRFIFLIRFRRLRSSPSNLNPATSICCGSIQTESRLNVSTVRLRRSRGWSAWWTREKDFGGYRTTGTDSDLFSANTEWVAATPLIIIELHDWLLPGKANSRAFLQCNSGFDRDFVYIDENIFSIDNNLMANRLAA